MIRDHLGDDTKLKSQHLRYILFWMCEDNFQDWDEEQLGLKLKKFFRILYRSLAKKELPHYFVDDYNMFQVLKEADIRIMQVFFFI